MEHADNETVQELKKEVLNLKDDLAAQGSSLKKIAEEMRDHIETRINSLQDTTLSPSTYEPVKTMLEDVRCLQENLGNVRSELDSLSKEDLKKINLQLSNVSKNIVQLKGSMDQKFQQAASKEAVAHLKNDVDTFAKRLENLQKAMDAQSNENVSKGRIDELETQVSDLKKGFVSLREDVDTQRSSLKDMQPGSTGYQSEKKTEADHSNLEMDLRKMQRDMEEQRKTFASKETVEGLSTRLSDMEGRFVELPHDAKEQLSKMFSTETTINKLSTIVSILEKQTSELPSDLEERLDSMASAETVNKLSGKVSKLEDGFKKVPSDAGEQLESLNRVTSDMEERINSLASAVTVKSLATKFAKVEKRLHKIPDDLEDRLDNKASADTVDTLSKNLDAFKSELNEDRKKLNGRLEAFNENLSRADDEIKSAKSSIVELSTSVKSAKGGVEGVQTGSIEQKELKNLEITVEVLQKDHKVLKTQFTENKVIWDEQIDKVKHLPEFVFGLKRVLNKTSQDTQLCIDHLKLQSVGLKNVLDLRTPQQIIENPTQALPRRLRMIREKESRLKAGTRRRRHRRRQRNLGLLSLRVAGPPANRLLALPARLTCLLPAIMQRKREEGGGNKTGSIFKCNWATGLCQSLLF